MRAVVVYESMYGNTHQIADAIGDGLRESFPTEVISVHAALPEVMGDVGLVVVGGPTHVHSMSRESTRQGAAAKAAEPDNELHLDADAAGEGVREWLESLGQMTGRAAAFDTRVDAAALVTGRASKGIAKQLRHHGFDVVVDPMSFLVTKDAHLEPDETNHARQWGQALGLAVNAG